MENYFRRNNLGLPSSSYPYNKYSNLGNYTSSFSKYDRPGCGGCNKGSNTYGSSLSSLKLDL